MNLDIKTKMGYKNVYDNEEVKNKTNKTLTLWLRNANEMTVENEDTVEETDFDELAWLWYFWERSWNYIFEQYSLGQI